MFQRLALALALVAASLCLTRQPVHATPTYTVSYCTPPNTISNGQQMQAPPLWADLVYLSTCPLQPGDIFSDGPILDPTITYSGTSLNFTIPANVWFAGGSRVPAASAPETAPANATTYWFLTISTGLFTSSSSPTPGPGQVLEYTVVANGSGITSISTPALAALVVPGSVTASQFNGSGAGLSAGTVPNAALATPAVTSVSAGTGMSVTGTSTAPIVNISPPVSVANGGTGAASLSPGCLQSNGSAISAVPTPSITPTPSASCAPFFAQEHMISLTEFGYDPSMCNGTSGANATFTTILANALASAAAFNGPAAVLIPSVDTDCVYRGDLTIPNGVTLQGTTNNQSAEFAVAGKVEFSGGGGGATNISIVDEGTSGDNGICYGYVARFLDDRFAWNASDGSGGVLFQPCNNGTKIPMYAIGTDFRVQCTSGCTGVTLIKIAGAKGAATAYTDATILVGDSCSDKHSGDTTQCLFVTGGSSLPSIGVVIEGLVEDGVGVTSGDVFQSVGSAGYLEGLMVVGNVFLNSPTYTNLDSTSTIAANTLGASVLNAPIYIYNGGTANPTELQGLDASFFTGPISSEICPDNGVVCSSVSAPSNPGYVGPWLTAGGAATKMTQHQIAGVCASGTTCTVNFSPSWTAVGDYACTGTPEAAQTSTPYISAKSTTAITFTLDTAAALDYICSGY